MLYTKHKNIITNYSPKNTISDEYRTIAYDDLGIILAQINTVFLDVKRSDISCLAVPVENTVAHALIVLFLLCEDINFHLLTSHPQADGSVPPFCDKILIVDILKTDIAKELFGKITINNNCHHKARIPSLPNSGLLFFRSSGTTGVEKFIGHKRQTLTANAGNCVDRFGYTWLSRILVPVPINHMYGFGVGLLPALLAGASIYLIDKNNVLKFITALNKFKPTISLSTPSVVRMLEKIDKSILTDTIYITAGEKIETDTYAYFESRFGRLINLYGSTELGAIATTSDEGVDRQQGFLRVLNGVDIRIDPENKHIVCKHDFAFSYSVNKEGNLIIRSEDDNWFQTRDVGDFNFNGDFRILGRIDNSLNRAGFLIQLEELETELKNIIPNVKQVLVFEVSLKKGIHQHLVAALEVSDQFDLTPIAVKRLCQINIDRHLVPDEFIMLTNLPILPNGKPDRLKLKTNISELSTNK